MQIYLVGGAVRDRLLNYPSHDRDWVVVGARPQELLDLGYQQVGKDFPVFLHPKTKEEYALARKERKQGSGYHGFICDFGPDISLEEDLSRRDLRINAMAMNDEGEIIDPYGGQQDIQDKTLRHISDAFSEDPLRVIRVARYAARYAHLGFIVAPETIALMTTMSANGELTTIAAERLWVEFSRAIGEASPSVFFCVLQQCGALSALFPQWSDAINRLQLDALDQSADAELKTDIRFAISCSGMSEASCIDLCARLRSSKSATQIAQRYAAFTPLPALSSAEQTLQTLEQFDYLRRPELLDDFCAGAALLNADADKLQQLQQAAMAAANVQAAEMMAEGIKGPALGKALRERRLQTLKQLLEI